MWISACIVAFYFNAHAGSWSNEIHETGVNPTLIRMITTYTPQYLARSGRNGYVGAFHFGELACNVQGETLVAFDGFQKCFVKRRKMGKDEYRNFTDMSLYFDEKRCLLYKIVMEEDFPNESTARERMSILENVVKDINEGFGLSLDSMCSIGRRLFCKNSNDDFEIMLELCKNADGVRKLRLSVTSIKVRDDLIRPCSNTNESFNLDAFVDVSI